MSAKVLSKDERARRLKTMLTQIAGADGIESVATGGGSSLEMAAGERGIESARVRESVQKLELNRALGADDLSNLEAIILPNERPVAYIRHGKFSRVPQSRWQHLNAPAVQARFAPLLPAIGRVELPNSSLADYFGTAFVVGPNLLMTNRHVGRIFTDGVGTRRLNYHPDGAAIDFQREDGVDGSHPLRVVDVVMIHPFWDMALLKVDSLPAGVKPLGLSVTDPENYLDKDVIIVGYPARDSRNDLDIQDRIFEHKYGVKRFQPGKARRRETINSFGNMVSAMTHDASTLGGNSGSAVIDLDTGAIIALHFAGVYLKANYSVPIYELARDSRVVDAGLNFVSRIPTNNEWGDKWVEADGGERSGAPQPPQSGQLNMLQTAGGSTFTIPLYITVSVGMPVMQATPQSSPAVAPPPATDAAVEKKPTVFPDLNSRKGYRADFLGLDDHLTIALPQLTSAGKNAVVKLAGGSHVLNYHKFSVVMHASRRLALFTAANVDWRPEKRKVNGRRPTRKELNGFEGDASETWLLDPRIAAEHQLPDYFFTKDDGAFDKGHLVRRDDVAYGDDFADMQKSNGDTFHVTNCSPQTAFYNRPKPSEFNWGALETMIQKQTKTEKVCLFSGPVLDENDRYFHGQVASGQPLKVQIPSRFWKIIVANHDGKPAAFGFVLDQDLADVDLHDEMAVPTEWKEWMVPISEIEDLLGGLAKLSSLKDFDQHGL